MSHFISTPLTRYLTTWKVHINTTDSQVSQWSLTLDLSFLIKIPIHMLYFFILHNDLIILFIKNLLL